MMPVDVIEDSDRYLRNTIPVNSENIQNEYMKDLEHLRVQIGDRFFSNYSEDGNELIQHDDLVRCLGAEALRIVEDTSYRFWSEKPDQSYLEWSRLVWRFMLTAPLGYLSSHKQVTNYSGKQTWCPSFITLKEFGGVRVSDSNRKLSGSHLGLGMYMKIFPDFLNSNTCGQMMSAVVDAFDFNSSNDNPIRIASKRGIKRALSKIRDKAIPYWWIDFINEFFEKDESFRPIVAFDRQVQRANNQAQVVNIDANRNKVRENVEEEKSNNNLKKANTENDLQLVELVESWLINKFRDSEFLVNKKGAKGHIYRGRLWVVSPLVFDIMGNELSLESNKIIEVMVKNGLIQPNKNEYSSRFEIQNNNGRQIGKCFLAALGKNLSNKILNEIEEKDDNEAFHILK